MNNQNITLFLQLLFANTTTSNKPTTTTRIEFKFLGEIHQSWVLEAYLGR